MVCIDKDLGYKPLIFILRFGELLTCLGENRFLWGLCGIFDSRYYPVHQSVQSNLREGKPQEKEIVDLFEVGTLFVIISLMLGRSSGSDSLTCGQGGRC